VETLHIARVPSRTLLIKESWVTLMPSLMALAMNRLSIRSFAHRTILYDVIHKDWKEITFTCQHCICKEIGVYITDNTEDQVITQAIIAMGETLGFQVVAEGVETTEQMNYLKGQSCDEMQGYCFSGSIKPEQFAILMRKQAETITE